MFKKFLFVAALLAMVSVVTQAQTLTPLKFALGTTPTEDLKASRVHTSSKLDLSALKRKDTLLQVVYWVSKGDTCQASSKVNCYVENKLLGTIALDSLVFGFNTDKIYAGKGRNINFALPPGTTSVELVVTESATYNKNGNAAKLGAGFITK